MYFKTPIKFLLLLVMLVTATVALSCSSAESGKNVDYDKLIQNQWKVQSTDFESRLQLCFEFSFHRSTTNDMDLIITAYNIKKEKEVYSMFMQYVEQGQYQLWNTSDPGFKPSDPGDVKEIGQATFVQFGKILFTVNYFELKTCYTTEDGNIHYDVLAIAGANALSQTIIDTLNSLRTGGNNLSPAYVCPNS